MKELHDFLAEIDTVDEEGQKAIAELVEKTTDLKQLPIIARKIMQVIENPRSTAGDLERVIHSDQALSTKMLKIANSSFYGLLRKVTTLQRAILVVGFKAIKDIAVSTAILNMYRSSDPFSIKLWEHAVGSGIAARIISLEFDQTEVEEAFIGGLLHDLGKSLLLRNHPDEIKDIWRQVQADPTLDETDLEKKQFGFSHTHAGGFLARAWNLSPSLEAIVRYHHHLPEILWTDIYMELKLDIAIVALADRFCKYLGIGYDEPNDEVELVKCPENEFLKINEARIGEIAEEVKLAFFTENQIFS